MPQEVDREFRRARLASRIGSVAMYLVALLGCVIGAIYLYTFIGSDANKVPSLIWWVVSLAGVLAFTGATFCLARFLRDFCKGKSPFGSQQSRRLFVAGLLYAVATAIDAMLPPALPVSIVVGPLSFMLAADGKGLELKAIVLIVFPLCLAAVVRYGDAIKRDSDSMF